MLGAAQADAVGTEVQCTLCIVGVVGVHPDVEVADLVCPGEEAHEPRILEIRDLRGDLTEEHLTAFGWAAIQDLDDLVQIALRVNDFLNGLFYGIGIKLIDVRLEFGRIWTEEEMLIVLADEISPDSCRLWDLETNEKLDKDRFRKDLGRVEEGYQEIARRLGVLPEAGPVDLKGPKLMQ